MIQLNIKDVHVRFEADVFRPNCPFACGITIESLVAQKTNDKWVRLSGQSEYKMTKCSKTCKIYPVIYIYIYSSHKSGFRTMMMQKENW